MHMVWVTRFTSNRQHEPKQLRIPNVMYMIHQWCLFFTRPPCGSWEPEEHTQCSEEIVLAESGSRGFEWAGCMTICMIIFYNPPNEGDIHGQTLRVGSYLQVNFARNSSVDGASI